MTNRDFYNLLINNDQHRIELLAETTNGLKKVYFEVYSFNLSEHDDALDIYGFDSLDKERYFTKLETEAAFTDAYNYSGYRWNLKFKQ